MGTTIFNQFRFRAVDMEYSSVMQTMTNINPETSGWVTKAMLAEHLHVSPRYIEILMKRHNLPYRKTGAKCVRFNVQACEQALARFDVKPRC